MNTGLLIAILFFEYLGIGFVATMLFGCLFSVDGRRGCQRLAAFFAYRIPPTRVTAFMLGFIFVAWPGLIGLFAILALRRVWLFLMPYLVLVLSALGEPIYHMIDRSCSFSESTNLTLSAAPARN